MTAWRIERVIEAQARAQLGAFSHRQALSAGMSAPMIRRRVAKGRWLVLDHGVYAMASSVPTFERQVIAATLAVPHGAACRTTAATLHGFTGFRPGRVHVVTALGDKHRSRLATVHRSGLAELTRLGPIPVVSPAHCVVELAGVVTPARLRAALHDRVVQDRRMLPSLVDRYVEVAHSRLPGIGMIRALLEELGDGGRPTESELERKLLGVLERVPGLPPFEVQASPSWWSACRERFDVLVPRWRLIVEADGRAWHTRVDDFERDRVRDAEAAVHGHHVVRVTWHRLTSDEVGVVDQLTRYGRQRQSTA
jgi:hypothetical protein